MRFKQNDRVFSILLNEWGRVIEINQNDNYSVIVKFKNSGIMHYTRHGKFILGHKIPDISTRRRKVI